MYFVSNDYENQLKLDDGVILSKKLNQTTLFFRFAISYIL
ncbi:hypothetical protein HMPREF0645_2556 [Hallella bergensis DSM 17361]|uniref:Uncharacterized protein n=1 Tax=Hallella bergensis DSM 17361 TaxID=585502 RepID=D1Q021_9BACT|nr:hypothetical protein HMPREF0645_2556 [Hallella bergensis DSM 17361]